MIKRFLLKAFRPLIGKVIDAAVDHVADLAASYVDGREPNTAFERALQPAEQQALLDVLTLARRRAKRELREEIAERVAKL